MKYYDLMDEQFVQTFCVTSHSHDSENLYSIAISYDFVDKDGNMIREDDNFMMDCYGFYDNLADVYISILKMIESPMIGRNWSLDCLLQDCETHEEVWFDIKEMSVSSANKLEQDFKKQVNAAISTTSTVKETLH
jgi:hypothetical protein